MSSSKQLYPQILRRKGQAWTGPLFLELARVYSTSRKAKEAVKRRLSKDRMELYPIFIVPSLKETDGLSSCATNTRPVKVCES